MTDLRELKRQNLLRIMKEEHVTPVELARRLGTTRQNVQGLIEETAALSDKSVTNLAKALKRDPIEFVYQDWRLGSSGLSNEDIRIMLDVQSILQSGDDIIRRNFIKRIDEYKELINREKSRQDHIEQLMKMVGKKKK